MAELILPGVYIEVRPEGLIVPGQISVGNLGVVGTASKGEVNKAVLVSSYADALQWYHRAADQNYAPAEAAMGRFYGRGLGVGACLSRPLRAARAWH